MSERYTRQMIVPGIGEEGQARIAAARLLVIGAGGLGATVLPALVGAGAGEITLLDPDVVDMSNLHRQTLFTMEDVGRPKALVAAERLAALNPDVTVTPVVAALDPANAEGHLATADLALDAADSFAATYILSDRCAAAGKPLVSASVLGLQGYAGAFCGGAPSYRALFPTIAGQAATCATAGVLGPAVAMLGALQAQMALSLVLGLDPTPLGRVVSVDLASWRFSSFVLSDAAEPEAVFPFLSAAQLRPGDRVLDLRGAEEAPELPDYARRIAPEAVAELPPGAGRTVLCCRSGLRAWRAAETLSAAGHADLALMATGG